MTVLGINLIGVAQALLLAGALLTLRRGNRIANLIFAALIGALSVLLMGGILVHTKYIFVVPHLAQLHVPVTFLLAPLFYLYVRVVIESKLVFTKRTLLHLIPFTICVLYLIPFCVQSGQSKSNYLMTAIQEYPAEWLIRTRLGLLREFAYLTYLLISLSFLPPPSSGSPALLLQNPGQRSPSPSSCLLD